MGHLALPQPRAPGADKCFSLRFPNSGSWRQDHTGGAPDVENHAGAHRTKGAQSEESYPYSDSFPVVGRLALRLLAGRWPQPDPVQPYDKGLRVRTVAKPVC